MRAALRHRGANSHVTINQRREATRTHLHPHRGVSGGVPEYQLLVRSPSQELVPDRMDGQAPELVGVTLRVGKICGSMKIRHFYGR